jgi:molybdate transport system permease protein
MKTAAASTVLCLVLGVPMALVLARSTAQLVWLLRSLILLPLVLPPVVGGMALLYAFGRLGLIGAYLDAAGINIAFTTTAINIAFTTTAVVLAQTFVSLPFLVIALEGAARTAGSNYEVVAATLGARPSAVWWRVTLPPLLPGLVSGAVLAFARSLGEFGATLTFAGSRQGVTRTLPLEIYLQRVTDADTAVALSLLLVAVAAVVVLGLGARRLTGIEAG